MVQFGQGDKIKTHTPPGSIQHNIYIQSQKHKAALTLNSGIKLNILMVGWAVHPYRMILIRNTETNIQKKTKG